MAKINCLAITGAESASIKFSSSEDPSTKEIGASQRKKPVSNWNAAMRPLSKVEKTIPFSMMDSPVPRTVKVGN